MNYIFIDINYREPILTNRSDNSVATSLFDKRNNSHKVTMTSAKRSRSRLENSNSQQKRRVTEQARLMKIKKFPPCFIQDKSNEEIS